MVNQHVGNHGLGIFWCGRIWLGDVGVQRHGLTLISPLTWP